MLLGFFPLYFCFFTVVRLILPSVVVCACVAISESFSNNWDCSCRVCVRCMLGVARSCTLVESYAFDHRYARICATGQGCLPFLEIQVL